MPEITVYEGDDSKAYYTLEYGESWSNPSKAGTAVLASDVSTIYFYVKTNLSDTSAWLTLTNADQISWRSGPSATDGKISVDFSNASSPKTTRGHTGDGQHYELRLKFMDGTYITAEAGTFNVLESVVDEP